MAAGYACFYDENERAELWGANLVEKLQQIYEHDSRYCVIIVSRDYVRKAWTTAGIAYGSDAPRSAWDQLNDSDRAGAVPVFVDEHSIAAL